MNHWWRIASALILCLAVSWAATGDDLDAGFRNPPDSAHPHTWWHWCDGFVTREGITRDLREMHKAGVRGVQLFSVGEQGSGPVSFMSPEYRDLVKFAIEEANRLGIEVCLHNCPGWSSSGGPWTTPEHAMRMLVWSEVRVTEPGLLKNKLPQPHTRIDHYKDIAVIALPTPPVERSKSIPAITTGNGEPVAPAPLSDGENKTFVTIKASDALKLPVINLTYDAPFTARSISLVCGPERFKKGTLQASKDGVNFETVTEFLVPERKTPHSIWANIVAFPETTARNFRVVFSVQAEDSTNASLAEFILGGGLRYQDWMAKTANFPQPATDGFAPALAQDSVPEGSLVSPDSLLDLTRFLKPDGTLDWQAPEGDWTVLRIGYTPIARTNHPAPPNATGYECDKLSREAVKAHFDAMMGVLLKDAGDLAPKTLNNVLIDSYETGSQNWTPGFESAFKERRGYDLFRWLPALTGRIVESPDATERFLWDYRRAISDLWLDNYYRYFRDLAHQNGLLLSVEGYGNGSFDYLTSSTIGDIPMSEFWVGSEGFTPLNKEVASAAHLYGKPYVGAEAFTSSEKGWEYDFYDLKRLGDPMFATGINRYIFHTYAHQPWGDRKPGMSMFVYGHQFNRNNTWWNETPVWLNYVSRCQWMLQAGRFVADVCYFTGEDVPMGTKAHTPPPGYDHDLCDTPTLMTASVKDGYLTFPSGMHYRVLVLPGRNTMTPGVARKLRDLVNAGATVLGPKPSASPSLSGGPQTDSDLERLANEVWGENNDKSVTEHAFGAGTIYWNRPLEDVLNATHTQPDVQYDASGVSLGWLHRQTDSTDIYFVCNRDRAHQTVDVTFRVDGRVPELWRPDTGAVELAPVFANGEGFTTVRLDFDPAGSVFVVFRGALGATDHVKSVAWKSAEPLSIDKAVLPEQREMAPPSWQLDGGPNGQVTLTAWQGGALHVDSASGKQGDVNVPAPPAPIELTGPWNVCFPKGWGAPAEQVFDTLVSWTEHPNNGIKYFSGTATYLKNVEVPAESLKEGQAIYLNLGRVKNIARVRVNGQDLGTLWKPPYRIEATKALRPGANLIEVDITNLWPNRMIGDTKLPEDQRYTSGSFNPYKPDSPLFESGLLGPVKLETALRIPIALP